MHRPTIDYYNSHADSFISSTVHADMSEMLSSFLGLIPQDGTVLDWGCGSGRDSLAMLQAGINVVPADLSSAMADATERLTGLAVHREAFSDLDAEKTFDGIWASASLLHAAKSELPSLFEKASKALKMKGILYVSFKYGSFEGERNGRWFNDLDEAALSSVIAQVPELKMIRIWTSHDVRPERANEIWLNAFLQKAPVGTTQSLES